MCRVEFISKTATSPFVGSVSLDDQANELAEAKDYDGVAEMAEQIHSLAKDFPLIGAVQYRDREEYERYGSLCSIAVPQSGGYR